MSIIPIHLQRRFEQRWAARFGSLVIPAVPKNASRATKAKEKPAGLRLKAKGK
jgi:hypothetical protein